MSSISSQGSSINPLSPNSKRFFKNIVSLPGNVVFANELPSSPSLYSIPASVVFDTINLKSGLAAHSKNSSVLTNGSIQRVIHSTTRVSSTRLPFCKPRRYIYIYEHGRSNLRRARKLRRT